jgi:hypothetical protein
MSLATLNNVSILNDVKGKLNNTVQCMQFDFLQDLHRQYLKISSLQPHRGRRGGDYQWKVFVAH